MRRLIEQIRYISIPCDDYDMCDYVYISIYISIPCDDYNILMCDYVYISIYISIPCDDYDILMCDYVYISIYISIPCDDYDILMCDYVYIREKRAEIREMKKRKAQKKKERLQVQNGLKCMLKSLGSIL